MRYIQNKETKEIKSQEDAELKTIRRNKDNN